ncbi:MAG TPA: VOC family protein, partial [Solirubrobacteraceae bacterium]|nr:VOC family protein [Solirubrobacteraceae bacterium]
MSTLSLDPQSAPDGRDFMPLHGIDHIELWVGNAAQAAYYLCHAFGFTEVAYAGLETGLRDRVSHVLQQGRIRLVLTGALREGTEIGEHQRAHGDGVKRVAMGVPDVAAAYREATARGARGLTAPFELRDEHGVVRIADIAAYGETVHRFVERADYAGAFLPGFADVAHDGDARLPSLFAGIDHVVANVELGAMERWVKYYEDVFAMTELIHFSDEAISTEYSALMSKVVTSGDGRVKLPIN